MQAHSHYIITVVLGRYVNKKQEETATPLPPLHRWPLMLGSIAPDVSLIAVTIILLIGDGLFAIFEHLSAVGGRVHSETGYIRGS